MPRILSHWQVALFSTYIINCCRYSTFCVLNKENNSFVAYGYVVVARVCCRQIHNLISNMYFVFLITKICWYKIVLNVIIPIWFSRIWMEDHRFTCRSRTLPMEFLYFYIVHGIVVNSRNWIPCNYLITI
jgi:hypothetical protein